MLSGVVQVGDDCREVTITTVRYTDTHTHTHTRKKRVNTFKQLKINFIPQCKFKALCHKAAAHKFTLYTPWKSSIQTAQSSLKEIPLNRLSCYK